MSEKYVDGWKEGFCNESDMPQQYFERRLPPSAYIHQRSGSITIFRKDGWNGRLVTSEKIPDSERIIANHVDYMELGAIILKEFHMNVPAEEKMLNA
ncbi:Uncharacterised protein [uncultured archaeon]|nr:Uncharacterised protein [uncultured archaeon]